ncbi:tryptophan ABC transporter substrate-binding protein [Lacticaseibacillus paracasei]|uniref:tryptophan ABC transporter substrate-binding protein n=1 Tax=Lacticaseibacillus paracasei TaxID=1597 RepID=UPI00073B3461|nr:tryptophan ABC transporter substrate-binding protein [Lacticaseibacillus paracasei]KTE98007.1 ABC transporter substrate-binding protein [Lacticaseibacillus paracasei]TXJ67021.1 ABC transporter substrate-binding protein [Lacticaseibacillus paracasei]
MKRMLGLIFIMAASLGIAYFQTGTTTPQTQATPTVGILQLTTHPALDAIHKGIIDGLKKKGYVAGKNVKIDFQNAENDQSNLKSMSERFTEEHAAATVGIATPSAQALANVNQKTPIILGAITDPVAAKLVKNVKRPGGNITGVSDQAPIAAQLKLIRQIMPNAKTLGVIATSSDDSAQTQAKMVEKLGPKQGFTVKRYAISSTNDLNQVATQMVSQVDAIFVPTDNTVASAMQTLVAVANTRKVPIFPTVDTMVEQGGLATIGLDQHHLGVLTGRMLADILSGKTKPATTPIHFETTGKLILNEKQAKLLGIDLPSSLIKTAEAKGTVIK